MEFYVTRAMEVARLNENQLNLIQARENKTGHAIPNWNIQEIFALEPLKTWYNIPDKPEVLAAHGERIKQLIQEKKLLKTETDDSIFSRSIEALHSFDWGVWRRRSDLDFSFHSTSKHGQRLMRILSEDDSPKDLFGASTV